MTAQDSTAPDAAGSSPVASISVRLVMPDRWLEHRAELPADTTVARAKQIGLEAMLLRTIDEPDAYYVEYAEREIHDESTTVESLGIRTGEILSIRAFDLGHYPRFRG